LMGHILHNQKVEIKITAQGVRGLASLALLFGKLAPIENL